MIFSENVGFAKGVFAKGWNWDTKGTLKVPAFNGRSRGNVFNFDHVSAPTILFRSSLPNPIFAAKAEAEVELARSITGKADR